jgi:dTDP-4-amino-4,6-dideoxygalactose transaminase
MTTTAVTPGAGRGPAPSTTVPFADLHWQQDLIMEEALADITEVVRRGDFILGSAVDAFERDLAEHHEVGHAVGVANGTDAIELALRALGVRAGDEVIVPTNTFIATAEAVERAGARVVLVDCEDRYLFIDPDRVADALTARTRAVVAVHLYGQAAPVELLRTVVGADVAIVEDAAQAHGARRRGRFVMGLGDVAATSFYPSKNLGAWGDAGAVLTSNSQLALRVRALRNHGSATKHEHAWLGTNSRLDTIQAVVLRRKLRHLAAWNAERQAAAARYHELLGPLGSVRIPRVAPQNEHVWHLYPIRVPAGGRDRVLAALHHAGIAAGIHYPVPVHRQGAFSHLGHGAGAFPVAEVAGRELLSLPIFPGITEAQQSYVVATLRGALERR